jgi:hypothetical protein
VVFLLLSPLCVHSSLTPGCGVEARQGIVSGFWFAVVSWLWLRYLICFQSEAMLCKNKNYDADLETVLYLPSICTLTQHANYFFVNLHNV